MLGKPIAHSLSPVIHNAGFAAAGLSGWSYVAIECAESEMAALLDGLGPEWAGLSVTMPLKTEALRLATVASPVARAVGAANTLVRRGVGWAADNTDVAGMVRVLGDAGLCESPAVTVLGGGGTCRAALAAVAQLGATQVTVVTRRPEAYAELIPTAEALGLRLAGAGWVDAARHFEVDAVISTVPKGGADHLAAEVAWRPGSVYFDAVYDPWPTPLAAAALAGGAPVVSGLDLLLAQAAGQLELMTGRSDAPLEAMRRAAEEALEGRT